MATFFSTPTNHSQRDLAGVGGGGATDMSSFHHYAAYSDSPSAAAAAGLMPFPATIVPGQHGGGGDDGRGEITGGAAEIGLQTQLLMASASAAAVQQHQHQHGLSLSLGTQGVPVSLYQYRHAQQAVMAAAGGSFLSPNQAASTAAAASRSAQSMYVQNSRYLKAARELMDEVVSVRDAIKPKADNKDKNQQGKESGGEGKPDAETSDDKAADEHDGNSSAAAAADLSPSERQDLQNKVAALMALLDQVDRKYRQYQQQMQAVSTSFDAVAGVGAARPYTALALQTISRHFRSLRDAVAAQVQSLRRSLGEKDTSSSVHGGGGLSRLRYIDQQLRQQRAMQQFGMMQQPHHAWRPQRGLPESAVSVLRAWLFEHFLHPYPKDSEKLMLARQTGLSRGQVSNWFINARVRLWKPMIEEMYREEFGAEMVDVDSHSSSENNKQGNNNKDDISSSAAAEDQDEFQSPSSAKHVHAHSAGHHHQLSAFKSEAIGAMDAGVGGVGQLSSLGVGAIGIGPYGTSLNLGAVGNNGGLQEALAAAHHHHHGHGGGGDARFVQAAAYGGDMAGGLGVGGYDGGSVSLTLGLQHCNDGGGGAVPAEHQQAGLLYGSAAAGDFEFISGSDQDRQRFGSSQLLHDFVA